MSGEQKANTFASVSKSFREMLKRENAELRREKRVAERALELLHDADVLCYRVAECSGDCKACWYTGLSQPIVAYAIAAAEIAAEE